jgi:hypothetical protein
MGFRLSDRASRLGLYLMGGYVGLGLVMLYVETRNSHAKAFGYNVPPPSQPEAAGPRPN